MVDRSKPSDGQIVASTTFSLLPLLNEEQFIFLNLNKIKICSTGFILYSLLDWKLVKSWKEFFLALYFKLGRKM